MQRILDNRGRWRYRRLLRNSLPPPAKQKAMPRLLAQAPRRFQHGIERMARAVVARVHDYELAVQACAFAEPFLPAAAYSTASSCDHGGIAVIRSSGTPLSISRLLMK